MGQKNAKKGVVGLVASYTFSPPTNGGQIAVYAFTKYLASQYPVVCFGTDENTTVDDFQLVSLFPNQTSRYFNPLYALRLRKQIKERNINTLGFQHHYHAFFLLPFLIGLRLNYFVFSHNIEYQRWKSIGKWFWPIVYISEWVVYQLVNKIFFISIDDTKNAPALFQLPNKKCSWVPYPIHNDKCPIPDPAIKAKICAEHGFSIDDKLLLFFGPQTYAPNLEAVKHIVFDIHPILKEKSPSPYKIIICGGGLPKSYNKFSDLKEEGIHYLGFVQDIESYVLACDLVLNPVNEGGGVKTKLVEAIALGKTVISTKTGALGIDPSQMGQKLEIAEDTDWNSFTNKIITAFKEENLSTPASFYKQHYGKNALKNVIDWIKKI